MGPESDVFALPPPLPKPYPGFWNSVLLFAIYVTGTVIVIIPFVVADQIAKSTLMKSPYVLGLATLGGGWLALLVAQGRLRMGWREIAGPLTIPGRMLGPMVSVILGQLMLTVMILLWLLRAFPYLMPTQTYGLDRTLIGAAFALMIAAPLSEEFLFRGVFLRGFVPRYGAAKGILLGAAMFAAAHFSIAKAFGTFLLGVIFGWWYTKMRSIWPGVLGHALNNGAPVLLALYSRNKAVTDKTLPPFSWAEPVFALIGIALLAQGVLAMGRQFEEERS